MDKILVDESSKDLVIETLRILSDDLVKYKAILKSLTPLKTAGYDNGEIQKLDGDILMIDEYINSLSTELGVIFDNYAGMDNAFARRLQDDRETYMSS